MKEWNGTIPFLCSVGQKIGTEQFRSCVLFWNEGRMEWVKMACGHLFDRMVSLPLRVCAVCAIYYNINQNFGSISAIFSAINNNKYIFTRNTTQILNHITSNHQIIQLHCKLVQIHYIHPKEWHSSLMPQISTMSSSWRSSHPKA